MAYGRFADIYDRVMRSVDYAGWAEYVLNCCHRFDLPREPLLNLACGTASLECELWDRGVRDILSVDASRDMLRVAKGKVSERKLPVVFRCGEMQSLDLGKRFRLVTCLYDSVNYLASLGDLRLTFEAVQRHLEPGGGFIFDITTEYNIIRNFADYTFAENFEDAAYIWENSYNIRTKVIVSRVTIFLLEDGVYRKYVEDHVQKIFPPRAVEKSLRKVGFEVLGSFSEQTFQAPHPRSERIHFVTRKRRAT